MEDRFYYIIIAAVLMIQLPIMPKIIRIRIAILRWLRLRWFADFHERHFNRLVPIVRVILGAIIVVLVYLFLSA